MNHNPKMSHKAVLMGSKRIRRSRNMMCQPQCFFCFFFFLPYISCKSIKTSMFKRPTSSYWGMLYIKKKTILLELLVILFINVNVWFSDFTLVQYDKQSSYMLHMQIIFLMLFLSPFAIFTVLYIWMYLITSLRAKFALHFNWKITGIFWYWTILISFLGSAGKLGDSALEMQCS